MDNTFIMNELGNSPEKHIRKRKKVPWQKPKERSQGQGQEHDHGRDLEGSTHFSETTPQGCGRGGTQRCEHQHRCTSRRADPIQKPGSDPRVARPGRGAGTWVSWGHKSRALALRRWWRNKRLWCSAASWAGPCCWGGTRRPRRLAGLLVQLLRSLRSEVVVRSLDPCWCQKLWGWDSCVCNIVCGHTQYIVLLV